MLYKLHYWFLAAGANCVGILIGVYIQTYTDASSKEIGALFMLMPFTGIILRPIICSIADRKQAHQKYLAICTFTVFLSYLPYVIIPLLGPAVYEQHPRLCWYILLVLKIFGDIGFGTVVSIGDALAINYSKRIETDFSVYRVWGTVSWLFHGLIIGQINEIPYLPKYVPGFMVLTMANLLDTILIWLWPKEYFKMVVLTAKQESFGESTKVDEKAQKSESMLTKSLMPKEQVLAYMKCRILSVFRRGSSKQVEDNKEPPKIVVSNEVDIEKCIACQPSKEMQQTEEEPISKMCQFQILRMLFSRDLRLILYLGVYTCAGMLIAPLNFFFISLSKICHSEGTCEFSSLTGYLQASMAGSETILFYYMKRLKAVVNRLNLCCLAFGVAAVKFTFYATIWPEVNPYYSLLVELLHGIYFGIFLQLFVEVGHMFANEVSFILPELIEKGVVKKGTPVEKLKLSLAATMQALFACAQDGLGRGLGSLVYGLIISGYDFQTLWTILCIGSVSVFLVSALASLFDTFAKPELGLDEKSRRATKQVQVQLSVNECNAEKV